VPSPEQVAAFVGSMPAAYAARFEGEVRAAHAATALARADALAAVGRFGAEGTGLCVVADDRPGLLATISAALITAGLDVVTAEVYTREAAGARREAVDLFWVRRAAAPAGPLGDADAAAVENALVRMLRGEADAASVEKLVSSQPPARPPDATVRFLEDGSGVLSTLEVETTDRSGLLFALATALFRQRVQIVESQVRTREDRVFDRFRIAELDGTAISPARRLEIQVAVLNAIEPASRSVPPPRLEP